MNRVFRQIFSQANNGIRGFSGSARVLKPPSIASTSSSFKVSMLPDNVLTISNASLNAKLDHCRCPQCYHDVTKQRMLDFNKETYGIGFVNGCPVDPKATEELCKRIAFIRETHYGSFWDFTSNLEHGDAAYTTVALEAHTDTTYFTDQIGLQIFHLLEHRGGKGGLSLWVDGFNCAQQLLKKSPTAYQTLASLRIPAACSGDKDTIIRPNPLANPILNHDPITRELVQVRFNNNDRPVLNTLSHAEIKEFYAALKEWMTILTNEENELWQQMKPGTVVALDNWRVLHGRSEFTGYRRLSGCYINWDDYRSRVRTVLFKGAERDLL